MGLRWIRDGRIAFLDIIGDVCSRITWIVTMSLFVTHDDFFDLNADLQISTPTGVSLISFLADKQTLQQ